MPKIQIKTEYYNQLKSYGIYDKWLFNVKEQWHDYCFFNPNSSRTIRLGKTPTNIIDFNDFLKSSFNVSITSEGSAFWLKYY